MSDEGKPLGLPNSFRPATGSAADWNLAYARVEDYLRAHRLHNRFAQARTIGRVLERAAARHAADPSQDPTALAAEEIEALMDGWFAEALRQPGQPHERIAVDGRVALLMSDGPQRWPEALFSDGPVPAELSQAMRSSSMCAGPDLAVSSMVARPIDLGLFSEAAGGTLETFERWPVLPTLALWALFGIALGAIFYLTR